VIKRLTKLTCHGHEKNVWVEEISIPKGIIYIVRAQRVTAVSDYSLKGALEKCLVLAERKLTQAKHDCASKNFSTASFRASLHQTTVEELKAFIKDADEYKTGSRK
jgi:hypothetical protein